MPHRLCDYPGCGESVPKTHNHHLRVNGNMFCSQTHLEAWVAAQGDPSLTDPRLREYPREEEGDARR